MRATGSARGGSSETSVADTEGVSVPDAVRLFVSDTDRVLVADCVEDGVAVRDVPVLGDGENVGEAEGVMDVDGSSTPVSTSIDGGKYLLSRVPSPNCKKQSTGI